MKATYTVILHPEPAGGFSVSLPAFGRVMTQGDTFEQAMENAQDLIETYLAMYAEEGAEIPLEAGLGLAVGLKVEVPERAHAETATAA